MLNNFANFINQELTMDTLGVLCSLVALETVLSADNAVALAALVQHLPEPKHQRKALNFGLIGAFGLRVTLILMATWVIQFWEFELAGAIYLIWLTVKYFLERFSDHKESLQEGLNPYDQPQLFWQIIPLIAVTDLAFSLDSVTTAVALSSRAWLVLAGGIIGVITLRFMAGLFVKLLEQFTYLQDAAYLTILGVGLKLMCKALFPSYVPPEWIVLIFIFMLFIWGFSKRDLSANSEEI